MRKLDYVSVFMSTRIPLFPLCKFEIKYHLHHVEKCLPEFNILLPQGNVLHLFLQMQPKPHVFFFQLSGNVVDILNLINLFLIFYSQICKDIKYCLFPHSIAHMFMAHSPGYFLMLLHMLIIQCWHRHQPKLTRSILISISCLSLNHQHSNRWVYR